MQKNDLIKRTKKFAINVGHLCNDLTWSKSIGIYSKQLIRCSSSVGANCRAACRAKSTADFINKLKIVEEEADESIYFLELLMEFEKNKTVQINDLIKEANEIVSIMVASIKTLRNQESKNFRNSHN